MKLTLLALVVLSALNAQMINLETQVTHQLQPANAGLGKVPGTVIPTTCSVGQVFVKTNSAEIYICTATDVWSLATGGGSGTVTFVEFTGGLISIANPTTTPSFTISGNSGGLPYFDTGSTWSSTPALTLNRPLFGGGAGAAPFAGTVSGNTTQLATWSGAATAARCVHTDVNGNLTISAADCGAGAGNMTITTGSGDPVGACTAAQDWYQDTSTTPKRPWYCDTSGTWRLIVTSSGSGAFSITGPFQATPSSPAVGSVTQYFDSTALVAASVGSGGVVGYNVKNGTCGAGEWVSDITAGALTCSAPTPGGVVTIVDELILQVGAHNTEAGSATPAGFWDIPDLTTGATFTTMGTGGGGNGLGAFGFAQTDSPTILHRRMLPSTWTGAVDVQIVWVDDTTGSGNVKWIVDTGCAALGSGNYAYDSGTAGNISFNASSNVTTASGAGGTMPKSSVASSVAVTNCAAGYQFFLRIARDNSVGSNVAGLVKIAYVILTIRRTSS